MRTLLPLFLASSALGQNLLVNGGFEQGPAAGTFLRLCPPNTQIVGWSLTRDCVDYSETIWAAAEGRRTVDLDGNIGDAGGVSQTFATTRGVVYRVTFAMAGNVYSGPAIKRMEVSAAGAAAMHAFDTTGRTSGDMGWSRRSFTFTATGPSATLEFRSLTSPAGYGPVIDDVAAFCAADFNGDGFLDFFDYSDYAACFESGSCPAGLDADFNGDGFVDFFDYANFVDAFEAGC